jgi:hypothetical protein
MISQATKPFASLAEAKQAAERGAHPDSAIARLYVTLREGAQVSEERLQLLKDVRKALDSGNLFVTRAEGRESATALIDRLNEAVGDPRSEAARKAARQGGGE